MYCHMSGPLMECPVILGGSTLGPNAGVFVKREQLKDFGGGEIVLGLIANEMKGLAALFCVALLTLDSREMQWASGFLVFPYPSPTNSASSYGQIHCVLPDK